MPQLNVIAKKQDNRTVLDSLYFTSPFKVAKPFYSQEKNVKARTTVMVMQASAGLLEGDENDISLEVQKNADLKYTGQSFTKVFRCPKGIGVRQNTQIKVKENASLIFSPLPIVPFVESIYSAETKVTLEKSSSLIYSDIFCCGRKERGEVFAFKSFISRTAIYIEDKLTFLDNTRFFPENCSLAGTGFFERYSHTGFMYIYGFDVPDYSPWVNEKIAAAQSECIQGKILRVFANDAQSIRDFFARIEAAVDSKSD